MDPVRRDTLLVGDLLDGPPGAGLDLFVTKLNPAGGGPVSLGVVLGIALAYAGVAADRALQCVRR